MKQLGWLVCKTFIEKKKNRDKTALLSFLPTKEQKLVLNLHQPSQDLSLGFNLKNDVLDWTHYSWMLPFLRSFSEKELCLFLSSLEKHTAIKLKNSLKFSMPFLKPSEIVQFFFRQKIANYLLLTNPDLLAFKALPKSPLNVLLELGSEDLRFVIELLGLHDLAIELKLIIDNAKLKKIYSIFSKEKEVFLKMLLHKKEPVVFKQIELSHWDEKPESLLLILFQRGLNRLAKAIYHENQSFVWYIQHRMDIEESHFFSSLYKTLEYPKAYKFLSLQVLEAVSFLRKIKPPVLL